MSSLENDYELFDLDDFREEKRGVEYYLWDLFNGGVIFLGGVGLLVSIFMRDLLIFGGSILLIVLGQIALAAQDIRYHAVHETDERQRRKWNTAQKKKIRRREEREELKRRSTSQYGHSD